MGIDQVILANVTNNILSSLAMLGMVDFVERNLDSCIAGFLVVKYG